MKSIIFDFDGTLVDSYNLVIKCANSLSVKYNFKPISNGSKLRNKSMKNIIKEDLKLKWFQLPFLVRDMKQMLQKRILEVEFQPNIINVLKKLSKNKRLFILTSNSYHTVESILKKHKIDFIESIYSDSSLFGKDKVISNLIRKYNLQKSETIYVGDEVRDIEACKKADMPVVAVSWGFNSKDVLMKSKPDFLIDNPEELLNLITFA